MTGQKHPSRILNLLLWLAQITLSASMIWAGALKLFQPVHKLALMWPWAGEVSPFLLKFTGVVDLLGGVALVFPWLLGVKHRLTPIAALMIVVLMICAAIFHIARNEASVIGVNIAFALLAVFVAWGRFKSAPVTSE